MTLVEESVIDLTEGGTKPMQSEGSRDLIRDLRDIRRADKIYDGAKVVPVENERLGLNGLILPRQAEVKPASTAQTLDEIRGDIAAEMPEQPEATTSVAEGLARRPEARYDIESIADSEFREGIEMDIGTPKTMAELRSIADKYVATYKESDGATLAGDEGLRGYIVESDDGWFRAIPGDRKNTIVMDMLNRTRNYLERRSSTEKAQSRIRELFDDGKQKARDIKEVHGERKESRAEEKRYKQWTKEAEARDQALEVHREVRRENQQAEHDRKFLEQLEADEKAHQDAARESILLPSLEDEIAARQDADTKPLFEQIIKLRSDHLDFRARAERRGFTDDKLKDLDAQLAHAVAEVRKTIDERNKIIGDETRAEWSHVEDISAEQIKALMIFEAADSPDPHVFVPGDSLRPEMAAEVAGANADELGKVEPPIEVSEYMLGKTLMQRIVYRTDNKNVVIVEDWDKSSGKLKRQAVIKGDKLLIPDYENDGLGRWATRRRKNSGEASRVLSNEAYAAIKPPITEKEVEGDSGTSYQEGYSNYTQNLVRSGGMSLRSARELASHDYKPKQSKKFKGFIASLQEQFTGSVKK